MFIIWTEIILGEIKKEKQKIKINRQGDIESVRFTFQNVFFMNLFSHTRIFQQKWNIDFSE